MNIRTSLAALSLSAVLGVIPSLAQSPEELEAQRRREAQEEAARQAELRRIDAEAKAARGAFLSAMGELTSDSRDIVARANLDVAQRKERIYQEKREQFIKGLKSFLQGQREFQHAVEFNRKLGESAEKMDKGLGRCLDLIRELQRARAPKFDSSPFKGFKPKEIALEVLAAADNVTPRLKAVMDADSRDEIDVEFFSLLAETESDLVRLRWLLGKLE